MRNALVSAVVAAFVAASGGFAAGVHSRQSYPDWQVRCRLVLFEDGSTKFADPETDGVEDCMRHHGILPWKHGR